MPSTTAWQEITQGSWITGPCIDWRSWIASRPLDPYLVWADATGAADLRGKEETDEWTPVLIELAPHITATLFQGVLHALVAPEDPSELCLISPIFLDTQGTWKLVGVTRFITAKVRPGFFAMLADPANAIVWSVMPRFQIGLPVRADGDAPNFSDQGIDPDLLRPLFQQPGIGRVVVGVLDDRLGFANGSVRGRMAFLWDQVRRPSSKALHKVPGFNHGREYGGLKAVGEEGERTLIEYWEARATTHQILDEGFVYPERSQMPLNLTVSHGTAVMAQVAAGFDREVLVAGVQFPLQTTRDTSTASLAPFVVDGLHYLLSRADQIRNNQRPRSATPIPLVANLSYGGIAGPHDGKSMLEAAIDDFIGACENLQPDPHPFALVIAAGNSRQARCHAEFLLDDDSDPARLSRELAWRVHPDDRTPSFMEIWFPDGCAPEHVVIHVTPPGHLRGPDLVAAHAYGWPGNRDPVCTVVFPAKPCNGVYGGAVRGMVLVALAPTAWVDGPRALAPSGVWRVRVTATRAIEGAFHAWIQRDDRSLGSAVRGRQSFFEDPHYVRIDTHGFEVEVDGASGFDGQTPGDAYVKRTQTMNSIATGAKSVVITGYRGSDQKMARYSSEGTHVLPVASGGPLAAQRSDDSDAHPGVLVSGTRSGSTVAMDGTSIAAPQVARAIIDILLTHPRAQLSQTQAVHPQQARLAGVPVVPPAATSRGAVVLEAPLPALDVRAGLGRLPAAGRSGRPYRRESDRG